MLDFNRRDFLRKGGMGLAATLTSGLWFDLLAKGSAPFPSASLFEERFGVTPEHM